MSATKIPTIVMVPENVLKDIQEKQDKILTALQNIKIAPTDPFITAEEFMQRVRIGRTKFNDLRAANLIKTFKKGKKIYLSESEVNRYFEIG